MGRHQTSMKKRYLIRSTAGADGVVWGRRYAGNLKRALEVALDNRTWACLYAGPGGLRRACRSVGVFEAEDAPRRGRSPRWVAVAEVFRPAVVVVRSEKGKQ